MSAFASRIGAQANAAARARIRLRSPREVAQYELDLPALAASRHRQRRQRVVNAAPSPIAAPLVFYFTEMLVSFVPHAKHPVYCTRARPFVVGWAEDHCSRAVYPALNYYSTVRYTLYGLNSGLKACRRFHPPSKWGKPTQK